MLATYSGVPGSDHLLDDASPAGHAALAQLNRETLAQLDVLTPADDTDEVTAAALRDRLGLEIEAFEAGDHECDLNNIASPLQGFRDASTSWEPTRPTSGPTSRPAWPPCPPP